MERGPWGVAGAFGLLHGLGFAGALSEVGLPQSEIPLALFSFNVGIELGQLALVLLGVPVLLALEGVASGWPRRLAEIPATVIGSLGVFWGLQRSIDWILG